MQYKNKRTVLIYMLVFLMISLLGMILSEHPLFDNFSRIFYGGLIVVWAMTVMRRIIEPQIKALLLENAVLLLMLILFQALRFQFDLSLVTVHRSIWYCYYIPICFIPVISFKLSLRCGRPENLKTSPLWELLFLPSLALSILIITNDHHHLAFSFPDTAGTGYDVYTYGPVYYLTIIWITLLIAATIVITIVRFSSKPVRKDSWAYYIVLGTAAYFLITDYLNLSPIINGVQFITPIETFSLFIVCGWEACIQTCLLPSNSGYKYFFENSGLMARILDKNGVTRISSKGLGNDWNLPEEDFHIMEKPVWGGRLYYAEDISAINMANRELSEISERLKEENSIQEAENSLAGERVQVSVMNKLYDDITEFSSGKTREIESLLNNPGDARAFKTNLEKACVLASYIKRRGNLYILGEESQNYDFNDIFLSFKESLDYFSLRNVKTLLTAERKNSIEKETGLAAYDCLEWFLENLDLSEGNLLVNLDSADDCLYLRLMFDGDVSEETVSGLNVRFVEETGAGIDTSSDGTTYTVTCTFKNGKEAAA